jgi:hypothetical protein
MSRAAPPASGRRWASGWKSRPRACEAAQAIDAEKIGDFDQPIYTRALVVFGGRTGMPWLRWLRPGFRHCFIAVADGGCWLTIDPLLHRLEVRATGLDSGFDLVGAYREMDLTVVAVTPRPVALRRAPLGVFTCVETVKRVLGIRARRIVTPWQLYRFLTHRNCAAAFAADACPLGPETLRPFENKKRKYP